MFVFPTHENAVRSAPPDYKTHIYPVAELDALKFDPDLDCSPPRQPQRETLNEQARAARGAEREAREAAQAARAAQAAQTARNVGCVQVINEHDFSSCTKCRLCKNHGHWAQDCPEARKAD